MRHLVRIGAILAGATAGAAVGVLLAPGTGEKTRNKILDQLKSGVKSVSGSQETLKDLLVNFVSTKQQDFETNLTAITNKAADKKEDVIATLERKLSELKGDHNQKEDNKSAIKDDVVYKAAYETKVDLGLK